MPRREDRRRRLPIRKAKHTALVFCGATRTEPDYFDGLKGFLQEASVTVKVRAEGVDPVRLVHVAAAYRDARPHVFDEVWCVVDVDEFDIGSAVTEAGRRGIHLAVSNPCFELWLLLHHDNCTAYCNGYADVAARLKQHLPGYTKTSLNFSTYESGIEAAVRRAEKLDPTGQDHGKNPSSNVWVLVKKLMEYRQ